jgi:hypothetical protein
MKNRIKGFVHEKQHSGHECAELHEAANRGEGKILLMSNSAYTEFVKLFAAMLAHQYSCAITAGYKPRLIR